MQTTKLSISTSFYYLKDFVLLFSVEHPTWTAQPADHPYSCSRDKYAGNDNQETHADTQTDLTMLDLESKCSESKDLHDLLTDKIKRKIFCKKILVEDIVTFDDESVCRYTGFPSKDTLNGVFDILNEAESKFKYWKGPDSAKCKRYQEEENVKKPGRPRTKLTRYDEYIMTLMRFRLSLTEHFLSDLFGVAQSTVSQVFISWVNIMDTFLGPQLLWPSKEQIKRHMPKCFKEFPSTRSIIDCTEFFIKKPTSPSAQSATYSSYKSHNTYKALIGISPSGLITFVSDLWGGNTSDRYITEHCGFLDLISEGDAVMADRGFTIRDLLLLRKATLIIPPFTRKCTFGKGRKLTPKEIKKTKNIAKLRIHVERAIHRLKKFQLLSNMSVKLKPLANQLLKVACVISNFHKPLVTDTK